MWVTRRLQELHPAAELVQQRMDAGSSQVGAEAVVLGPAEPQVAVRASGDVEGVRVLEHGPVTIRRRIEQCERVALGELGFSEVHVTHHRALHVVDRRCPANHLVHPGADVAGSARNTSS